MASLDNLKLEDKRVLVRVDFNVPLNEAREITDDSRMQAHLPTIKHIVDQGGKPILMSHLGRPKNGPESTLSLKHLVDHLQEISGFPVEFIGECVGEKVVEATQKLPHGSILLLENLRFHGEETKGDESFAKALADNGDVYVNDAFGTAHRAHASTGIIAQYFKKDKAFGRVLQSEIDNVNKVLKSGESPVCAIVGGAKVSSKISVLENLLPNIDHLVIGGGMAFTFIKAQGGQVGSSLVEDDYLDTARTIMAKAKENKVEIHLPSDTKAAAAFANDAESKICPAQEIPAGWMGLDAGPESLAALEPVLMNSKTILWNGPLGVFEFENFSAGTRAAAEFIAASTQNGAFSLIGGGDSVAAIKKFDMADKVSYVSTGGGAMLEFLEGKTLPGVQAIQD